MLSSLQENILKKCYGQKGGVNRKYFAEFYGPDSAVKKIARVKIITQSLERMIDRGMMIGYGIRTPKKWFIKEVKITGLGRKELDKWLNRKQRKLPV
jgi:hypothetical protein